jgi:hypothetical protein
LTPRRELVREFIRRHKDRGGARGAALPSSGSGEFAAGYRAGVGFALSLLPAEDADLSMFDLKGVRRELEARS